MRIVILAATLTTPAAYQAVNLSSLADKNVWWRLRTGLWILQNHAIPRTGLFSQAAWLKWVDASWGYDLLTAVAYQLFSLPGLPILMMMLQVAAATSLFLLACAASRRFWPAVILGVVAQFCIVPVEPRPALCSISLLALELGLLLRSRTTGNPRLLYWLPWVFLVWANLDRQFEYGLLALALFCIAIFAERFWQQSANPSMLSPGTVAAAALGSVMATLVTPYRWDTYSLLWQTANSTADRYFRELHAIRFRQPQDYALMLLVMTAFFAMGRRRSRDLFLIALMVVSAIVSFRLVRDDWFVTVVAVAVISNALRTNVARQDALRRVDRLNLERIAAAALVAFVIFVTGLRLAENSGSLMHRVGKDFPVDATNYIRANHLPQPIFNSYAWGGFLTWYLPEYPVFIDGRTELYGDQLNIAYFRLIQAEVPMQSDPSFAGARTILLETNSPMAQALSGMPGFQTVYRDSQAVVLVKSY